MLVLDTKYICWDTTGMSEFEKTEGVLGIDDGLPPSDRWRNFAECNGMDSDIFFPTPPDQPSKTRAAKAICDLCVVTEECLNYAITSSQKKGIWGGLDEDERRRYKRALQARQRRSKGKR